MPLASRVIIDTGSANTRAGLAGDQTPKVFHPTVVDKETGQSYPVRDGAIKDWGDVETLWTKVMTDEMGVQPRDCNVMLLDSALADRDTRERMAKIMFESLNVNALFLANPATLTCYSVGRLDGVVLQTGEGVIHAVPVIQGFAVLTAIRSWKYGGSGQTEYLGKLLAEKGLSPLPEPEVLKNMKESLCYVAENYKAEMGKTSVPGFEKTYKLPSGKEVNLGSEMFKATEVLFQPELDGLSSAGVAAMIHDAISQCSSDQQKDMYKHVILGGGPSMSPGFEERLKRELRKLSGNEVEVIASQHRLHSAWIGGSLLAALDDFQSMWVTNTEYKEKGVEIVHTKCK